MLELKVRKLGNSLIRTIPAEVARLYEIAERSIIEVIPDKDKFMMQSHSEKK